MSINRFKSGPPFDIFCSCVPARCSARLLPTENGSKLTKASAQFIPMDRRRRRQKEERGRELDIALHSAEECFANLADDSDAVEDEETDLTEEVNWDVVPECLDPACKEAELHKEGRAHRKRQQIASIVHHVRKILKPNQRCIEFGAGSGHLSLLLSWLFPECSFIMCERKEYSVVAAKARILEVFGPAIPKPGRLLTFRDCYLS